MMLTFLQHMLAEYPNLFKEVFGLPPKHAFDHHINLIPGARGLCSRPYHHGHKQESVINSMIQEMKLVDIICPNCNPFSSRSC